MAAIRRCKEWLQERTNFEKILLALSSALLLSFCLAMLFGITYKGSKSRCNSEQDECRSKNCIETAGQILSNVKDDVDPCSNFYKFACGQYGIGRGPVSPVAQNSLDYIYLSLKRLLESPAVTDVEDFDKAKSLYNVCLHYGGLKHEFSRGKYTLQSLLSIYGVDTWPVIDDFYDKDAKSSLEERLASLNLVGIPVVFKAEVIPDDRIPHSYILKLSPGGPEEAGRSESDIRDDQRRRFQMISFFLFLGASEPRAREAADDILAFEADIATIDLKTDEKKCTDSYLLSPQESLRELDKFIPHLNWTKVMNVFWKAAGTSRPYAVKLHCKEKIRKYAELLTLRTIKSCYLYFGWRFISAFSRHIDPSFHLRSGQDPNIPRWKECIYLLEEFSSPLLAEALTKAEMKREIQATVEKVSSSVLSSTNRLLSKSNWLSSELKYRLLQQVEMMDLRFPFKMEGKISRKLLFGTSEVNTEYYSGIVINLYRQRVIENLKKISPTRKVVEIVEPWEFQLTSGRSVPGRGLVVSAFFDKILEPYIRIYGPEELSYGGFGTSIAREVSRILLREDSELHINVLLDAWESNIDVSSCLIDFLDDRLSEESLIYKKELFLDQSSLEIAYESMKTRTKKEEIGLPGPDMSKEQMFFLAYAQTMCGEESPLNKTHYIPVEDRLNVAVSNSKAFAEAFKCNSILSSKQCQFWT
ncbi:neprilysin-2-like [Stegodyphus dumicola]|uniref:neprilysin-2-like n=1 Tax=Stegodyphus dumicola TaxID=202533 RepID=UPI0015A98198|nr:neprilysin-2-like [Stegodyphus dumicola]